jgi:hypothetical protein
MNTDEIETDRGLLMWLHERLEHVHGEHPLVGYMHRLRGIIAATPEGQKSKSMGANSLDELKQKLHPGNDLPVIKRFGVDFHSGGGALTLNSEEVSEADVECGTHSRTHASGWTITGDVRNDYYVWVNDFKAEHPTLGRVEGDFEVEVRATSEEAFKHFWENHEPAAWDYHDI